MSLGTLVPEIINAIPGRERFIYLDRLGDPVPSGDLKEIMSGSG
jgi:hypothetical protein